MKSSTTTDFWRSYSRLPLDVRQRARKAYRLWRRNPKHPSLCFKKVGDIWSIRIDAAHRATALLEAETFFWFWIGGHDEYERLIAAW
ncbi:MAG: hypothetical protein ABFC96_16160 [Thermoguttaceae bacterium]